MGIRVGVGSEGLVQMQCCEQMLRGLSAPTARSLSESHGTVLSPLQ